MQAALQASIDTFLIQEGIKRVKLGDPDIRDLGCRRFELNWAKSNPIFSQVKFLLPQPHLNTPWRCGYGRAIDNGGLSYTAVFDLYL